jgi:hypothetical protein
VGSEIGKRDLEELLRAEGRNMVEVSIFSLIYQSPEWADFVYNSIHKYTPMVERGEAEFFFVANDATPEVLEHLSRMKYQFHILNNERLSDKELFAKGYGKPEYISRVYKGFNFGIEKSQGRIVVIVNSDMAFSPDWLENLLKYVTENTVITTQLVERDHPKFGIFHGVYHGEFGCSISDFKEEQFLEFVLKIKTTALIPGKGFSPCAFYKSTANKVGLYPEGNIAGKSFEDVVECGDERFFWKLAKIGIPHYTALDSIAYHFKEGEMTSAPASRAVPREIPQPNYYPFKPLVAVSDKIQLNSEPQYLITFRRNITKMKRTYKRTKHIAGMYKNKVLGR